MKKRIITGLILGFILIPLLLVPQLRTLLQIVIILFSIVATVELIHMVEKEKKLPRPVKALVVLGMLSLYIGIVNDEPRSELFFISRFLDRINFNVGVITMLTLIASLIFTCQIFIDDFDTTDVGICFVIIIYVALSFSSLTIVMFNGMRFIVYLCIICVLTDIFALVFGLTLGKHKLCPKISPKKTVEGAIGGTLVGTLGGYLFAIFYDDFGQFFVSDKTPTKFFSTIIDYNSIHPVFLGFLIFIFSLLISIASQIGDLICSKAKRTYGIKDFSQVFPGHGGVLDRFDSLLFASIVFLCIITIIRVMFPLV